MKLDTTNWQPFYVSDIFTIRSGKGITQEEILENPGDFIAVQSGEGNNGVMGKIDKLYCIRCNYTYTEEPCLTVARSGTAGFVSFQKFGCVVGDSAKILELKNKKYASDEVLLFLQTLLLANRYKFDYGYKVTNDKYSNIILKLPVDGSGAPDWQFMEDYVKSLHSKPVTTQNSPSAQTKLVRDNFAEFVFGDLIEDIYKGKAINKDELTEVGSKDIAIRYITRTAEDNGCELFAKLDEIPVAFIEKGNAISVGDTTATCFYQDEQFIVGDHMVVIRAKWLNKYSGLYITTLLNREQYKYSYGRAFVMDKIKNTVLCLPSTPEGEPDWQFMENYVKSLPYGDRI